MFTEKFFKDLGFKKGEDDYVDKNHPNGSKYFQKDVGDYNIVYEVNQQTFWIQPRPEMFNQHYHSAQELIFHSEQDFENFIRAFKKRP